MEHQIAVLKKPPVKPKYDLQVLYEDLVNGMQLMISGINSFSKLLLTANFHVRNVPNYEIQTKVNIEKYLYAYNMFLIKICKNHYHFSRKAGEYELVFPVFLMDLSIGRVRGYTIFPRLEGEEKSEKRVRTFLILCPNYQRFSNIYHVLPMITHEISHNFRYLSRKERNRFVFTYLVKEYSVQIANCILGNAVQGNYPLDNRMEWSFIGESVVRVLSQEILSRYEGELDQIHLRNILEYVLSAVEEYCGIHAQKRQNTSVLWGTLENKMQEVCKLTDMGSAHSDAKNASALYQIDEAMDLLSAGREAGRTLDEIKKALDKSEDAVICMVSDFSGGILRNLGLANEDYEKACSKLNNLIEVLYGIQEEDVVARIRDFVKQFNSVDENRQQYVYDQLSLLFVDFAEIIDLLEQLRVNMRPESADEKEFLKKLHRELYKQYQQKLEKCRDIVLSEDRWILRTSVQEEYTRIGILNPDADQFCDYVHEQMQKMNLEAFREDGEDYLKRYDEVCADLGMCEAFGFDYFGYFCYTIHLFMKERSIPNGRFVDMTEERVGLVIKTLWAEKKGVEKFSTEQLDELRLCLQDKVIDYGIAVFRKSNDLTEKEILDIEKDRDKAWILLQKKVKTSGGKCKIGACKNSYEMLNWMITLFYSMNLGRTVTLHEDLVSHFCDVRKGVRKSEIFSSCKCDQAIIAIGEYYNTFDEQVNNEVKEKECMGIQNEFVLKNHEQCMQMCNAWKKRYIGNAAETLSKMPEIIEWMYEYKEE